MGVGKLVTDYEKRRLAPGLRQRQHILHRGIGMGGGLGDDSLVGMCEAHLIQLAPVHRKDHRAFFPGLGGQAGQTMVCIS